VVLFEMGTREETAMKWADLPPMADGQFAFLESLMGSVGLVNIREIGRTPGFRRDAERILCVGEVQNGATGERTLSGSDSEGLDRSSSVD